MDCPDSGRSCCEDCYSGIQDRLNEVLGFAIDYIDERIEDDCDSTTGQVGQAIGADEGQCDEGSATRDILALIRIPILVLGIAFGLLSIFATYR